MAWNSSSATTTSASDRRRASRAAQHSFAEAVERLLRGGHLRNATENRPRPVSFGSYRISGRVDAIASVSTCARDSHFDSTAADAPRVAPRNASQSSRSAASSSYIAFLEGYARGRRRGGVRNGNFAPRARGLTEAMASTRPEIRYEPKDTGLGRFPVAFPQVTTARDLNRPIDRNE